MNVGNIEISMSPSTASEISIEVAANTETNHPTFFRKVGILLWGAAVSLGAMVMLLVSTVAGFFKEVSRHLLAAAEQLDDGLNRDRIVFILGSLINFAGFKAEAVKGFPFDKHETLINCSITSLLFFGIACVTQVFAPPAYKRILCLAKIACLFCSIVSLASAFYF